MKVGRNGADKGGESGEGRGRMASHQHNAMLTQWCHVVQSARSSDKCSFSEPSAGTGITTLMPFCPAASEGVGSLMRHRGRRHEQPYEMQRIANALAAPRCGWPPVGYEDQRMAGRTFLNSYKSVCLFQRPQPGLAHSLETRTARLAVFDKATFIH